MKEGIHPKYYKTTIRCACGNVIETGSTKENITVEICSKCHPFYTGKQKLVDTSGRVDKFNKKYGIKYSPYSSRHALCAAAFYFVRPASQRPPVGDGVLDVPLLRSPPASPRSADPRPGVG